MRFTVGKSGNIKANDGLIFNEGCWMKNFFELISEQKEKLLITFGWVNFHQLPNLIFFLEEKFAGKALWGFCLGFNWMCWEWIEIC
jgi:hypothetical protein